MQSLTLITLMESKKITCHMKVFAMPRQMEEQLASQRERSWLVLGFPNPVGHTGLPQDEAGNKEGLIFNDNNQHCTVPTHLRHQH